MIIPQSSIVIRQPYSAQYEDPIAFRRGDIVQVERADPEFPGWYWCRGPDAKLGWVHSSFLSQAAGEATGTHDYSAKELSVSGGEKGRLIQLLGGWAFLELEDGRVGWVPENVLHAAG